MNDWEWVEVAPCPFCGGPLGELGVLGSLVWYQCRNCGCEVPGAEVEAEN